MGGGEGGEQGQFAPGRQCKGPPNSAGLVQDPFISHIQSRFIKGLVSLYFQVKSACSFTLHFMLLMPKNLMWLLRSLLARALYVILFDLKLLIEDGNLQIYMYCVHARKRASGAPRTHFRACKISKCPGGVPPDLLYIHHFVGAPLFGLVLGSPILSAALRTCLNSTCEISNAISSEVKF